MKDILNLISRIENLPDMPAVAKGYFESLRTDAGSLLSHKDELEKDNKALREAKTTAETALASTQSDLEALKKDKPSKSSLDKLDAYTALGTPEELGNLKTQYETTSKELTTLKRSSTLEKAGFRPSLFMTALPDLDVSLEGEGESMKVSFTQDGKDISLEDAAKAKGLSADDLNALKRQPETKGKEALKQEGQRRLTPNPNERKEEARKIVAL